ncbi:MAG: M48 family metalloprotease [Proteobacteria bacterium]|nr:M48 family metalloprotease [Pseudomonadota bacterium]
MAACLLGAAPLAYAEQPAQSESRATREEVRTGARAAREVEQRIGLVRDPELNAYVARIGARLAEHSPRPDLSYRFQIVDMPETNAFALPGGHIYVSRGLLAMANSEDELANVLAHEIGHVAARHHAGRQKRSQRAGLLSALGTLAGAVLGGPEAARAAGALAQLAGQGFVASYSREQERESDRIGQDLAARAGWRPQAMAAFLDTLRRESELRPGSSRAPSFLDSHPSTPERVISAMRRARGLKVAPAEPIAHTRGDYLERVRGLLIGDDPAEGIFDGRDFLHADLDLHLRFPLEWPRTNAETQVAAVSPRRDALLSLELDGEGGDPRRTARRWLSENTVRVLRQGPLRINGLRAYRVIADSQGSVAYLTWIAHSDGWIYRVTGLSQARLAARYRALFERTANSFRGLTDAERRLFRLRTLQIETARPGETFRQLARRTGNAWSPALTAAANARPEHALLPEGMPVKIAVDRPYPSGG